MEIGDIVRLKSGGPKMVIEKVVDYKIQTWITCIWFDETGHKHLDRFEKRTLMEST